MPDFEYSQLGANLIQHLKAYMSDTFISGDSSGDDDTPLPSISGAQAFYFDPFNANLDPLSLPLPDAFKRVTDLLSRTPDSDHVVIWVSAENWQTFYSRLLATEAHPAFWDAVISIQARFDFDDDLADFTPDYVVISAGSDLSPLLHWRDSYDQVFSAVLVLRFTAGEIPTEYTT